MIDRQLIAKRIDFLAEQIVFLKDFQAIDKETFSGDKKNLYSAQLSLVYAIESLLDIGAHLISTHNWKPYDSYADIARTLFSQGVLTDTQQDTLISLAGFRNIVVHGYLKVNTDIVYAAVRDRLGDFESIADAFTRFL